MASIDKLKLQPGVVRPAVAGLTVALIIIASVIGDHTTADRVLGAVLLVVLGIVTVTDLEERRIPNAVIGPAALLALALGVVLHIDGVPAQAAYGLGTGLFLLAWSLISGGGLGMGDVKLGLVLGLYLGPDVIVALIVAALLSAAFGVGVILARGLHEGRRTWIAMGPFLAAGGAVAVLWGSSLGPHWVG